MTYTLKPIDLHPAALARTLVIAEIAVLAFVSIVVPLLIPRRYIPLNPEVRIFCSIFAFQTNVSICPQNPQGEASAEQTAPLLSLLLSSYLDPIIQKAYRLPHLPFEDLPPLCDYDSLEELMKRHYQVIFLFGSCIEVLMQPLVFGPFPQQSEDKHALQATEDILFVPFLPVVCDLSLNLIR